MVLQFAGSMISYMGVGSRWREELQHYYFFLDRMILFYSQTDIKVVSLKSAN